MFTSPKCLLPLVSLAYVYSNIALVTLAKYPGNKNAFNNSMSIGCLRIFLCVTGWLNHSIRPHPPPPHRPPPTLASSFWPRLANNTRAWPLRPLCASFFSRWAAMTAANSVPSGAPDPAWFLWGLVFWSGAEWKCSQLWAQEPALKTWQG